MVFNEYINIKTLFHKLNPLTKLLGLIILMIYFLLINNIYIYLLYILLILLGCIICKFPLNIIYKSIFSLRYFFVLILFFNMFLFKKGHIIFEYYIFKIYSDTLYISIIFCMRLILLVILNSIFLVSTKTTDLTKSLNEILKYFGILGATIAMILTLGISFIPILNKTLIKIIEAQNSRGMVLNKGGFKKRIYNLVSILIPLVIISFKNADNIALGLQLRGYSPTSKRTSFYKLKFTLNDLLFLFIIVFFILIKYYLVF